MSRLAYYVGSLCWLITGCSGNPTIDRFSQERAAGSGVPPISVDFEFNGFTEYWQNQYQHRVRYGNLFRMNIADVESTIWAAKVNLAEDLGIPGLRMQEGFLNGLLQKPYRLLENPTINAIEEAFREYTAVFVVVDSDQEVGQHLLAKYAPDTIAQRLNTYQQQDSEVAALDAFVLKNGNRSLYVAAGSDEQLLGNFKSLVHNTEGVLADYDLKKGWFGAQTLIKSVTSTPGTPIELIGAGMNEGNSWFVFDGYMEFLAKDEMERWLDEVGLSVVTDIGFSPIYGCEDYEGLQVQRMYTPDAWIDYARKKKGYVFRPVYDPELDDFQYDGYIASEGSTAQINAEGLPFVVPTGPQIAGTTNSMVVFHRKDQPFTRKALWTAIMDRKSVGVLDEGKMMGPTLYRNALQLLLLDRVFLEQYYGDGIGVDAHAEGNQAQVILTNHTAETIQGKLAIQTPDQISVNGDTLLNVSILAGETKAFGVDLAIGADAMARPNAILFRFDSETISKSTIASLELPPAVSVHELLYGSSAGVDYPATVYNFSGQDSIPITLTVRDAHNQENLIMETNHMISMPNATYYTHHFDLKLPAGAYMVNVSAQGVSQTTQLGIEKAGGAPTVEEVDLNNDGISEYQLENNHVKITLLTTGARVIEYIVKSRNDNIFFKLWPDKPVDDRRPFRQRGFYPYGGFEDFLGQPSIETHKIYDAEIIKKEGEYVQVKMKARYYGNTIEKIFTLYGNSPLLEVRFALSMKNPELNMMGPQPILELGATHGPEDVFIIPEGGGIQEYRMKKDQYYGSAFFTDEGWNAGHDTKADISFVGAFPVTQPIFLHMWMNHPKNRDAHHYYAEFQPWVPLYRATINYFSYYIWGAAGKWEDSLNALRDRNLITTK